MLDKVFAIFENSSKKFPAVQEKTLIILAGSTCNYLCTTTYVIAASYLLLNQISNANQFLNYFKI